jgi:arginine decarboxylase
MNYQDWSVDDAMNLYQIDRWSDGYFSISNDGDLCVLPTKNHTGPKINIGEVIKEMQKEGIAFPAVIRFHDILRNQVIQLNETFNTTINEAGFKGKYFGVYPIKVNQLREVVEEVVDAGSNYTYGLEAGSKAEILAALSMKTHPQSLTILNGYKDEEFMQLALLGKQLDKNVIVVIEKLSELYLLMEVAEQMQIEPMIGVRAKLNTKGSGKWADSTGDFAKFGLTIPEILEMIEYLKHKDKLHWLQLFHFHVGSQIPDIRTIKECITEGARIYTNLKKLGAPIQYFDVGGGVGVNYDGSRSNVQSSVNYSLEDYVGDVVYLLKDICELEQVDHPNIVSESGRLITAHHSCVVTNVFGKIEMSKEHHLDSEINKDDHILVRRMKELNRELNHSNYQDIYNDACILKEEAISAFKLGVINIQQRSTVESIYSHLCNLIIKMTENEKYVPGEIRKLKTVLADKYLCNFSVFQSCPDSWAIKQILPVVPIQNLNKEPTREATLADITCDSDGKVAKFLGPQGHGNSVRLHDLHPDQDYHVGLFLTGAYQDVMGDMHNLFGRLNEVHVFCDDDDPNDFYIEEVIMGHTAAQVLTIMQYHPQEMCRQVKNVLDQKIKQGKIKPRTAVKLTDFYESSLYGYTYLEKF